MLSSCKIIWCISCLASAVVSNLVLEEDVARRQAVVHEQKPSIAVQSTLDNGNYTFCNLVVSYLNVFYKSNSEERKRNTALLFIKNSGINSVNYTWQHSECYECPVFAVQLGPGESCIQRVQTARRNVIVVHRNSSSSTCPGWFLDSGEYNLTITDTSDECDFMKLNNPYNPDLYVLYAFLFYALLAVAWVALNILYRRKFFDRCIEPFKRKSITNRLESKSAETHHNVAMVSSNPDLKADEAEGSTSFSGISVKQSNGGSQDTAEQLPPQPATIPTSSDIPTPAKPPPKQRLNSLDAFRGLSLTIMIFVNYGGAGYWFFEHAPWNGLTLADTVFPWFLWMMGTSLVFSFRGLIKRKTPAWLIVWKIVWRSIKLFAIGLFMGTKWGNNLEFIRIPGVLQRFGITYLVAALVYYPFAKRAKSENGSIVGDIILFWPEWMIHLAMLAVYLGLTFGLPLPNDCPTGYLGPGGLADWGQYPQCTGGAAGYADLVVFTEKHMYLWPTSGEVYYTTAPFDPEGLFTTIPSIFLVLLGSQAGKIIAMHSGHKQILIRWIIWGVITGCLALLLCEAKQDGGWIPINKNLWSMSYIFAMASTAFLLLAIMYVIIDVLHIWNGAPFIYPGMNSIVIYICHSVFSNYFPVSWAMPDPTSHWQALILCCWGTSLWVFVAYVLHKKRIYVAL